MILQFLKFTPPFIVGLHGLNSDPLKPVVVQYIEKISHTETFIIVRVLCSELLFTAFVYP